MARHKVTIQVDLRKPLGRLQFDLHRLLTFVSMGLSSVPKEAPSRATLPESRVGLVFSGLEKWTSEHALPDYQSWLLASGFRDVSEALGRFLEEVHRVLAATALFASGRRVSVTGAEFNEAWQGKPKRFHRMGLPDKLTHLEAEYGFVLEGDDAGQLLSVNAARNCLVHRNGVVSERDVDDSGAMVVRWRRVALFVEGENGRRVLDPPADVDAGDKIGVGFQDVERRFEIGSRVSFSSQEFSDLCWSLYEVGRRAHNQVVERARDAGLIDSESSAQAEPDPPPA